MRMTFKKCLCMAVLLGGGLLASAQTFTYDVRFDYGFDNREFDVRNNRYASSRTLHAARLTPSVGLLFPQDRSITHSVHLGVDLLKNMGESRTPYTSDGIENIGLLREMTLWYGLDARLRQTRWTGLAGIFPARHSVFGDLSDGSDPLSGRNLSTAFLSDANRFFDNNMEGLLVKAVRAHARYEVGLDWMGMPGIGRREQFRILSFGKGLVTERFYAGWALQVHHYAGSENVRGVVDDILLSPFLELDLTPRRSEIRLFTLSVAWLESFQRDRQQDAAMRRSGGVQGTVDFRWRALGLRNEAFFGGDLLPLYGLLSPEGTPYGTDLYRGTPFFRAGGPYDRAELYWQPVVSSFLDLRLGAVLHFADGGFQGWQQRFTVRFDLEKARASRRSTRSPQSRMRAPSLFDLIL